MSNFHIKGKPFIVIDYKLSGFIPAKHFENLGYYL